MDWSSAFHQARFCKTSIWTLQDIETSQISKLLLHMRTYFMELVTKREPRSPPFTCTRYKNKLLNNRWLAANSKNASSTAHSTHLETTCPALIYLHLMKWKCHQPPLTTATCPEFNLPLRIRISIWSEALKVGYNQCPFVPLNTMCVKHQ